jgi:endonuclease YncB( thermonuclease family)
MGCNFSSSQAEEAAAVDVQPQQKPTSPITAVVYGKESPVYKSLPSGAEKYMVRNVYDGDTLTLVDERRVRFLGIDTPELKEKQPFAEEAKEYTKKLCHKKEIFLTYDGKKQDHYGRLLAFVWVAAADGGYLCVNEGIVAEGLAFTYIPDKNSKTKNFDKLISLQKQARAAKKGIWSQFKDYDVVATVNGAAYHKRNCQHIAKIKNLTLMKASEATDKGLHPCRTCLAD